MRSPAARPARRCAWRRVTVRHRPGSCCSRPLPSGVSTDSGWNWTPSAGSSRWRIAIRTPPPRAVTSKHVGQVAGRRRASGSARRSAAPAARRRAPRAVVLDLGRLAVDGHVADDLAAERLRERLVAEADAERRDRRPRGSARIASTEMPASSGVHGPGETTTRSEPRSSSSSTSRASLRTTSSSAPSSPRYWTRL